MNLKNYTTLDFNYTLPESLIATNPLTTRDQSRLLVVQHNHPQHDCYTNNNTMITQNRLPYLYDTTFNNLINYINQGDLVIFNDSKVIKARLFGNKQTGGKIEVLIERVLDSHHVIAHVKSNKSIMLGLKIILPNNLNLTITEKLDGLFKLSSNNAIDFYAFLEQFGHIPLPHYMHRDAKIIDNDRYQTVYAKDLGSIAAPTAGLHFTQELLDKLTAKGVQTAQVTLHVGSGTFKPVTVENIHEHKMHSERYSIPQETIRKIKATQITGGKIIAVGTTSLRTLEAAALADFKATTPLTSDNYNETNIFITPGFKFKVVDKLITNFHLPKSTLLMLVSAFSGVDTIKTTYQHAINSQYRFFSYGDAMLLERQINHA